MAKTERKMVVISNIRQTAPKAGSTFQTGNPIINGTLWVNNGELRNLMLGAGIPVDVPISSLTGLEVEFVQLTITQEDIDKGVASGEVVIDRNGKEHRGYIHTVQGRKVAYAKPGVNNVNLDIDFSPLIKHYSLSEVVKTKMIVDKAKREQAAEGEANTRGMAPVRRLPVSETTISQPDAPGGENTNGNGETAGNGTLTEMPAILKGIKDDKDGNKTNADGSPLSDEQQEALSAWVQNLQHADPLTT